MVKDVQRRLSCQELKYPRRRLSTPTFAAGLKFRLKAMALAGPFFVQRNDTESWISHRERRRHKAVCRTQEHPAPQ
jgi:hypothetical protein